MELKTGEVEYHQQICDHYTYFAKRLQWLNIQRALGPRQPWGTLLLVLLSSFFCEKTPGLNQKSMMKNIWEPCQKCWTGHANVGGEYCGLTFQMQLTNQVGSKGHLAFISTTSTSTMKAVCDMYIMLLYCDLTCTSASVLWPDKYICLCTVTWHVHLPLYCDLTCRSASVLWCDM